MTCPTSARPTCIIEPAPGYDGALTTFGLMLLLARAFSSGCAALTGVEAISNGVPAFRRPKSRNAATTLLLLGLIAVTMILSVVTLAKQMGIKYVDPLELERLRAPDGRRCRPATTRTRSSPRSPRRSSTGSRPGSTSWWP